MTVQLTEELIRLRATGQSFDKGQDYFLSGAIYNPSWQSIPNGVVLLAYCEGNSAPAYRVSAALDEGGVRSASCTCAYDWGGDCKHIIALLLTYLHHSETFNEQKSVHELLAGLDKEELAALIERLVKNDPEMYDALEIAILAVKSTAQIKRSTSKEKHHTQVSEQAYRKQVKRIMKQRGYEDEYDEYGNRPAYLDDLEEMLQTAQQFIDTGDAEGALIILRVLLEEATEDYDADMDYDGDVASFIQSLGGPMAEAILSADLGDPSSRELEGAVVEVLDNLDEAIEKSELEVISAALEYGWDKLPDKETQWDEYDEETWMLFDELQRVRLNVLERQGHRDEFLQLAQKVDAYRYTLKLLELGRLDAAIAASQALDSEESVLSVAQKLRDAGRMEEFIALAERCLNQAGQHSLALATWLAPLEEARGNVDMALSAYLAAFEAQPAITWYRHLKRLSGASWNQLRPALMRKVNETQTPETLVNILLEEKEWDAAIDIAEKSIWFSNLLEKVADAVIPYRPDWVIRTSIKQADQLILKTQSNLYPAAAKWLARAKKAYQLKGQPGAWQEYIDNLRSTYARRPALQRAIAGL